MNLNRSDMLDQLRQLELSEEEAAVWTSLLDGPKTHLAIAQATGIGRTTVYRLIDALSGKSLVHELATEQGNLLEAAGPEVLELLIQHDETTLQRKRQAVKALSQAIPTLQASDGQGFYVKTYYGVAGLKQMLWNELKTQSEVLIFARTTLNDFAGAAFAEKFRAEIIERGIRQRALENVRGITQAATQLDAFMDYYDVRFIEPSALTIGQELTIHDDIVSVYNWEGDMMVGTETKNTHYATFMRQVFETYWRTAER